MLNLIKKIAEDYYDQLIEYRQYLHENPELSFQEFNTSTWIRKKLSDLNIPILEEVGGNSVVGILDSKISGPVIAFRADIDALPIQEENQIPYKSKIANVMHACGHDAHTATLLCLAEIFTKYPDIIKGKIKFIFQQGEEKPPGGGKLIVEDKVLDDVDHTFAWHVSPEFSLGEIAAVPGPRTAAVATYEIDIKGRGGHGGFPHTAIDPISTGCAVATAIHQIVPQCINSQETAVITVSHFNAGINGAHNIIPETAVLQGNIRTLNNELILQIIDKIKETADFICKAKKCTCHVNTSIAYPAVINSETSTEYVKQAINNLGYNSITTSPIMGCEDFAYYLLNTPGTFINIGSRNSEKPETLSSPHNPKFMLDEEVMKIALKTLLMTYYEITK